MRELLRSRETITQGREVTKFPLVLARLTVLKVDFPDAYAEIVLDSDLLEALDQLAKGSNGLRAARCCSGSSSRNQMMRACRVLRKSPVMYRTDRRKGNTPPVPQSHP